MEKQQQCPVCIQEVDYSSRYPQYLCSSCSELTTDAEGRAVAFFNTSILGQGCQGQYQEQETSMIAISAMSKVLPAKPKSIGLGGLW